MTAERMCELGQVSRAGLYRFDPVDEHPDKDLDLRDEIQRIALAFPCYGRPRVTAELKRRGWEVNHKRVGRILREDNLLCLRKRKFVVTTDSNHNRKVYPNLARDMILTATDQLWRADITYIRLRDEFVFLAVILDAYSRRVIGWALERTLKDELTLGAHFRLSGMTSAEFKSKSATDMPRPTKLLYIAPSNPAVLSVSASTSVGA
jgi:putative transposase